MGFSGGGEGEGVLKMERSGGVLGEGRGGGGGSGETWCFFVGFFFFFGGGDLFGFLFVFSTGVISPCQPHRVSGASA